MRRVDAHLGNEKADLKHPTIDFRSKKSGLINIRCLRSAGRLSRDNHDFYFVQPVHIQSDFGDLLLGYAELRCLTRHN